MEATVEQTGSIADMAKAKAPKKKTKGYKPYFFRVRKPTKLKPRKREK
jgi:hypothetical protein